jgi:hypothetical protein
MKHFGIFVVTLAAMVSLFWYGGVDFSERTPINAYLVIVSAFVAFLASSLLP